MADQLTIRNGATKDFCDEISALAREIWREHYEPITGLKQIDYMLDQFQSGERILEAVTRDGYVYYAAYFGETPVGYCAVRPEGESLFLSKLYVHKDFRKRGIAGKLLEYAVRDTARGAGSIYLTVNKKNRGSIEVYHRLGFVTEKEIVTDIGGGYVMDDYLMRKELKGG